MTQATVVAAAEEQHGPPSRQTFIQHPLTLSSGTSLRNFSVSLASSRQLLLSGLLFRLGFFFLPQTRNLVLS